MYAHSRCALYRVLCLVCVTRGKYIVHTVTQGCVCTVDEISIQRTLRDNIITEFVLCRKGVFFSRFQIYWNYREKMF